MRKYDCNQVLEGDAMTKDVQEFIWRESCKKIDEMDVSAIVDGLDHLCPFNEEEDVIQTQKAWQDFQNRYLHRNARRRLCTRPMIIIATSLSLIILGTGICSALGIDLWTMVVEWTQEYLLMSMKPATEFPDETEMPGADLPQSRENVWGTELYDLMEEHEIYVQLPLWKPEGYELVDIKSVNNSEQQYTLLSAEYESKEGGIFAVLIREFKAPAALENLTGWLEADENLQESFKQGEKTYYIVNNFDHFSFTWNDRMYNIHISGDISYETIMQMIASLHQSEEENS